MESQNKQDRIYIQTNSAIAKNVYFTPTPTKRFFSFDAGLGTNLWPGNAEPQFRSQVFFFNGQQLQI